MARLCSYATPKTEEYCSIDLADLRRWGMLTPRMLLEAAETGRFPTITWKTRHGHDHLHVIAKENGVLFFKKDEQQGFVGKFVPFRFTPTQFGGRRHWFACPGCGKGCRVLYGIHSLRCRRCRGLQYESQYESPAFRLLSRAQKIRRKLGQAGPLTGPLASKPRRMRWRTYRRLENRVYALEEAGWRALSASLK
jgi:hypothetical protein